MCIVTRVHTQVLRAFKAVVSRTVELKLQTEPEAQLVAGVMTSVSALKKLPRNQAHAVQKQVFQSPQTVICFYLDLQFVVDEPPLEEQHASMTSN